MPREWARLKAKAPAVLARRTPYVAAASGTNRLLIGPFDSLSAARDVVNRLSGVGISTFPWPSPAGEDVDKPAAKCGQERRSEEHTSELQSLMRISHAAFCLKNKTLSIVSSIGQRHMQTHHKTILPDSDT